MPNGCFRALDDVCPVDFRHGPGEQKRVQYHAERERDQDDPRVLFRRADATLDHQNDDRRERKRELPGIDDVEKPTVGIIPVPTYKNVLIST